MALRDGIIIGIDGFPLTLEMSVKRPKGETLGISLVRGIYSESGWFSNEEIIGGNVVDWMEKNRIGNTAVNQPVHYARVDALASLVQDAMGYFTPGELAKPLRATAFLRTEGYQFVPFDPETERKGLHVVSMQAGIYR